MADKGRKSTKLTFLLPDASEHPQLPTQQTIICCWREADNHKQLSKRAHLFEKTINLPAQFSFGGDLMFLNVLFWLSC